MKARLNFLRGMRKKFGSVIFLTIILSLFSSANFKLNALGRDAIFDGEVTINASDANFNWYRDGIKLGDNVTFSNPFPIGSRGIYTTGLDLNDLTLTLSSDLYLGDETLIGGAGNIDGGGVFSLILSGDVKLGTDDINIAGNTIIVGGGNILDFNGIDITVATGKALTLKNIVLRSFTGTAITMAEESALYLENVVIELSGDVSLGVGNLTIRGSVIVKGSGHTFTLASDINALSFEADSVLYFDVGTTFDVNKDVFAGNATSALHFNGCTIDLDSSNLTVDTGLVLFENKVTIQGANSFDASAANIKVLSGARIELDNGAALVVN